MMLFSFFRGLFKNSFESIWNLLEGTYANEIFLLIDFLRNLNNVTVILNFSWLFIKFIFKYVSGNSFRAQFWS